jgi:hypothetical protein
MRRSLFLLIAAIVGLLFGGMMFFTPGLAAEGFGISSIPETLMFFRAMGESILAMGVLAFLVRNDNDSKALKSIFIFFIIYHGLGLLNDFYSISQGLITFNKVISGILTHLFIGIGSIYYALKIKTSVG